MTANQSGNRPCLQGRWDEEFARRKERWYRDGATQQQSFEQEQEDLMFLIQLHDVLLEGMGGTLARFRASREKVMRLSKTRRWGELLLELRRRQGALRRAAGRFQELLWPQCTVSGVVCVVVGAGGGGRWWGSRWNPSHCQGHGRRCCQGLPLLLLRLPSYHTSTDACRWAERMREAVSHVWRRLHSWNHGGGPAPRAAAVSVCAGGGMLWW